MRISNSLSLALIIFAAFSPLNAAGTKELDSLLMSAKIQFFIKRNTELALFYADQGKILSEKTQAGEYFFKFCHIKANCYLDKNLPEFAKKEWDYALNKRGNYGDFPILGYIYTEYGQLIDSEGDLGAAIKFDSAFAIFNRVKDRIGKIGVFIDRAVLYEQYGLVLVARNHLYVAKKTVEEEIRNRSSDRSRLVDSSSIDSLDQSINKLEELQRIVFSNLALLCLQPKWNLDSLNKAISLQTTALQMEQDTASLMSNLVNLSYIYVKSKDKIKIDSSKRILETVDTLKLTKAKKSTYHYVLGFYYESQNFNERALSHYIRAYLLAKKHSFSDELITTSSIKEILKKLKLSDSKYNILFEEYSNKYDSIAARSADILASIKPDPNATIDKKKIIPSPHMKTDFQLWIGLGFLAALIVFLFITYFSKDTSSPNQYNTLRFLTALCAGFAGGFLTGQALFDFEGTLGASSKVMISGTAGCALFFTIWFSYPKRHQAILIPAISISIPEGWTFEQAVRGIVKVAQGIPDLDGFTKSQLSAKLSSADFQSETPIKAIEKLRYLAKDFPEFSVICREGIFHIKKK